MTKYLYQINGKSAPKREFERLHRNALKNRQSATISYPKCEPGTVIRNLVVDRSLLVERKPGSTWPMVSEIACGVDPRDVPKTLAYQKAHGITGVSYNAEGDAIFSGPQAYERYKRHYELADRGKTRSKNLRGGITAAELEKAEQLVQRHHAGK